MTISTRLTSMGWSAVKRNKAAVLASGIDPELKRLRYLQAKKADMEKKYVKSLQDIEDYWEKVENSQSGSGIL